MSEVAGKSPASRVVPSQAFATVVPLLVLRRSVAPLQHATLAVARTAGRVGVEVHSLGHSPHDPAGCSRYMRGLRDLPELAADSSCVEALRRIGDEFPGAVLVPVDDRAAVMLDAQREPLQSEFRIALPPAGVARRLSCKHELQLDCERLGVPTPRGSLARDAADALELARELSYPIVLKRSAGWLPASSTGAPSVAVARDRTECLTAYHAMESPHQPNVLIQEYIPGAADSIWMFNGYFDSAGRCRCAFTARKLRQRGPGTGPTTLGETVPNPAVRTAAIELLTGLKYHGIVDMGFRYDARDGSYKLLDVNPRLGSTFRLFVGTNGMDVVRAMHLDLTGRETPVTEPDYGRRWLDEPHDLLTGIQMIRQGTLSGRAWARSLSQVDEAAWWARDDMSPFAAMLRAMPRGAARLLRRQFSRAVPAAGPETGGGPASSVFATPR